MSTVDSSDYYDGDDEDMLRKAARAGILLLEKNQELQEENAALRAQVAVLEDTHPSLRNELQSRDDELVSLRDERKKSLLEINALRNELNAKSGLVTDALEREHRMKGEVEEAEKAKQEMAYQLDLLQAELAVLQRKKEKDPTERMKHEDFAISNPAHTYDSNQASVFTWSDYEELMQKWQATAEENDVIHVELKSLRKEIDSLRRKASRAAECLVHIERLEKKNSKLQHQNDTLYEELAEERAVLESVRTMNLMYKVRSSFSPHTTHSNNLVTVVVQKIADSRPFSTECSCSVQKRGDAQSIGISVQDVLLDRNMVLETEICALRLAMAAQRSDERSSDNQVMNEDEEEIDLVDMRRLDSDMSTISNFSELAGDTEAAQAMLLRKVQSLQEKLMVARDMLKHTKLQWSAAVASQKALEECNRSAQDEITRLTQSLEYQMSALSTRNQDNATGESPQVRQKNRLDDNDDEERWVEETAPYPAPPGDLNSPLIKCLLDHWTTDKSKIMTLTDWLHHAIRGTGKPTPLRLQSLTSEVAAGFAQLLVPIMREKHGVSVSIYRRDSVHILSDLVLQTNQPSTSVPSYSTMSRGSSHAGELEQVTSSQSRGTEDSAARSPWNQASQFLMGETQFLYG